MADKRTVNKNMCSGYLLRSEYFEIPCCGECRWITGIRSVSYKFFANIKYAYFMDLSMGRGKRAFCIILGGNRNEKHYGNWRLWNDWF